MFRIFIKTLAFLLFVFQSSFSISQEWLDKIQWSFKIEKIDDQTAYVVGIAKLKEGWHIYSVNHDPAKADLTGYPTKFIFPKSGDYILIGKLMDGQQPKIVKDELGTHLHFEKSAIFKQKIKVLNVKNFELKFDLSYQICDANGCLFPPDQSIKLKVSGFKPLVPEMPFTDTTIQNVDSTSKNKVSAEIDTTTTENIEAGLPTKTKKAKDSNFIIFIAGFLAGLLALFTPCMFPMIPMTVSFFTKQSKTRMQGIVKALIYGLSIIVIYVSFGLIFTAATGPLGLNDLSTNLWMNMVFFLVFVIFAFSFLGAFEIQLPNSWVNKMDRQADRGGYIGIFFMAFTLGLVSFSCTGPIIGSLLVEAATSGSFITPAIGMVGFSLALAIPFTLFAIFPGWMNSLPKSGGWLNSVKVVLGLIELALALKFLSAVDLAYHWNLLTREWFVGIWFVLFAMMGLYLLGKIRFSHDSPVEKLSVTRFMFALLALVFATYLFTGMFGAPLKVIDGIAPPRTHSEDNFRFVNGGLDTGLEKDEITNKYSAYMHPVGDGSILVFHDLEKAKEFAKLKNLPILIDFTGHACQNCRKTESSIWTHNEIRPILQKQLVIASLYVDDRTPLPASEIRYSKWTKSEIKTIGNKWAELQIMKYNKFSQPLYIIGDHNGNDLTEEIAYTPDIYEYKRFLLKGIQKFRRFNP